MKIIFVLLILVTIQSESLLVSQDNDFVDDDNDFAGGVFPTTDSNSDISVFINGIQQINFNKHCTCKKLIKIYNKALQYAQQHYAESCKLSDLQWESLDGSKNQMVQGMLYYFNVTMKGNERLEKYEIQVWVQTDKDQTAEITQCKKL